MLPLLLTLLCQFSPEVLSIPVVKQSPAAWRETVRREGLPRDSVGVFLQQPRRVIILLANHPEIAGTLTHERAHAHYRLALTADDRAEWEAAWATWRGRLPWEPARRRSEEAWAYLVEALSPESPYHVNAPLEAVALLLRLRRRE